MALEAPPASSPAVHNVMIANTSKDTKPELRVRRMLRDAGYPGYRLHWRIDDEDDKYDDKDEEATLEEALERRQAHGFSTP